MRVQNEYVINRFLEHKNAHSPIRNYVNGYYMVKGSSISTDGHTLYSYSTPIARWQGDTVLVNNTHYSHTTTLQQSDLMYLLSRNKIKTAEMPEQ